MMVAHPRLGRKVRLSRAFRLFGRHRGPIEEAFPGDVIGVVSSGLFAIEHTISTGEPIQYPEIPRFPPEHFAVLTNNEINRYKQFHKGLTQLQEEGAVQVFHAVDGARREPILAVVGDLQFDVVVARLREEYGVEARLQRLSHVCARWVDGGRAVLSGMRLSRRGIMVCRDRKDHLVLVFASFWDLEYFQKENPDVQLLETG